MNASLHLTAALAAGAVLLYGLTSTTVAAPIVDYELSAVFADGDQVRGTIRFDGDRYFSGDFDAYTDAAFTSSGGATFPNPLTFTESFAGGCGDFSLCSVYSDVFTVIATDGAGGHDLDATPAISVHYGVPGELDLWIVEAHLGECVGSRCESLDVLTTSVWQSTTMAGTEVPVPAALPLLATALGGLAWLRHRRRSD